MLASRPRIAGILVTASILAGVALFTTWGDSPPEPAPLAPPARGGQLVASVRSQPSTLNRLVDASQITDLLATLTQGRLVRVNRSTFDLEPWLAERWDSTPDGQRHTFHLRRGVTWSDGAAFTAADVLFTLEAVFDPRVRSPLAGALMVAGQPIRAEAPDSSTVIVSFAGPSGIGARLLDNLPIYPKHKLEAALGAGALSDAWRMTTTASEMIGTGPFVFREYQVGERVVLERNPRYWRKASDGASLPYLDRLVLEIVQDPGVELVRLQAGETQLVQDAIRPDDLAAARRAERQGRLTLVELGISPDPDAFFFCLDPGKKKTDPRFAFVRQADFRRAISHAVNREAFAETVFLGEAMPVWGPITPGNRIWFSPNVHRYPYDPERARALLEGLDLRDRDGNSVVEDSRGVEARFTILTQRGPSWYEKGTAMLREQAAKVGIAFDVVTLEVGALRNAVQSCDYDAAYMRFLVTDLDPAAQMDFWLSTGTSRFWEMGRTSPPEAWAREIDALMQEQAATTSPERRLERFELAQRVFSEHLPVLYFAAQRMYTAHSVRLNGVQPSVLRPPVLWNADTLSLAR